MIVATGMDQADRDEPCVPDEHDVRPVVPFFGVLFSACSFWLIERKPHAALVSPPDGPRGSPAQSVPDRAALPAGKLQDDLASHRDGS